MHRLKKSGGFSCRPRSRSLPNGSCWSRNWEVSHEPLAATNRPPVDASVSRPGLRPAHQRRLRDGRLPRWTADPNWVIAHDTRGYYSGWQGNSWAWSGGQGETSTGRLRSQPFVLDKEGVGLRISGWSSVRGTGQPRKWNYVTLNLADGREIDRAWAPIRPTSSPRRSTVRATAARPSISKR